MGLSLTLPFVLCALLLSGAVSPAATEPLTIRTLDQGAFSAIQEPKQELIQDQAAWEKLWAAHTASRDPKEAAPKVDFAKEMVIVATMGRQRSGGYAIEISQVQPHDGKLRISIKRATPRAGAISIQALTAPFHFVAVPKSKDVPEFVDAAPVAGRQP